MRGKAVLALVGAVALGTGIWLGQNLVRQAGEPASPSISGILFPEPREVKDFSLVDQAGQPFRREHLEGNWTFVFFGFTYCPDVCPMTLAKLSTVQQRLAQRGLDQDTAYMLISVDPQRDTPERLKEYTAYFNPKFQGATGIPEELAGLARQFGVFFERAAAQEDDPHYTVDHSSAVILIDPDARLHAVFTQPHEPEALVADFIKIREHYAPSPTADVATRTQNEYSEYN